jgi:hypothetical protein
MLRYLLIATVLVVLAYAIAATLHRFGGDLRVAAVQTTASPSPPRLQAQSTFTPGPLRGDAPWVLVALVDCFRHERTWRGTLASVSAHVPRGARLLPAGARLDSGPCAVEVSADGLHATRAAPDAVDVRVPAPVRVYAPRTGAGEIDVLRWTSPADARLDRLATMPNARLR